MALFARVLWCLCALATFPGLSAQAQSRDIGVNLYHAPVTLGATLAVARPQVLKHRSYAASIIATGALEPFRRGVGDTAVVGWLAAFEGQFALGLFEYLELGAAASLVLVDAADDPLAATVSRSFAFRAGDPRFLVKVPVLRGDFALSARAEITVPTGTDRAFAGTDRWTLLPSVLLAYNVDRLTLAGDIGYRLRDQVLLPGFEYDDEIDAKLGVRFRVTERLSVTADGLLRVGAGGRALEGNETPAEALAGVRWVANDAWTFESALGTGISDGYGAPLFRGVVHARFQSSPELCAAGPEDFDGFEDADYCADLDNDADGIPDTRDQCENDAEDLDGFADEDGCPDLDDDADGIRDTEDRCRESAEDRDGFEDADGCPDLDNDLDKVLDRFDSCPMEPEDIDDYEDLDGCPEPGPRRATVTVSDSRILISERIYFDFDRDTIRPVSKPLLDQVASVVRRLPGKPKVRVEGYTDNAGEEAYNKDLSYRRARAVVEYLVGKGVARARMSYVGYGSQTPVAPNDSPDGRALNRRVEFTILN